MEKVPGDPKSGQPYDYRTNVRESCYWLKADLEGGSCYVVTGGSEIECPPDVCVFPTATPVQPTSTPMATPTLQLPTLLLHCRFNNSYTCDAGENPSRTGHSPSFSGTVKEGNYSLYMDNDDEVSYSGSGNVNDSQGTLTMWVQINGTQCYGDGRNDPTRDREAYFLYRGDTDNSPSRQPYLVFNDGYLKFESNNFPRWGGSYWNCPHPADNGSPADWKGRWHHIAAAWQWQENVSLVTRLWTDGNMVATGGLDCAGGGFDCPVLSINNIDVGSHYDWAGKAADGYIDDFRIYDRVLTTDEVIAVMNDF